MATEDVLLRLRLQGQKAVQAGLAKTGKSADDMGRRGARAGNLVSNSFGKMAKRALGAGAAFAGAYASIAGAKNAISTTTGLAKTTLSLNRNLGMGVEQASRWAAVAKSRNVDAKALNMSFGTLSKNISGATSGTKASAEAFKKLGISQAQLKTLGFDGVLKAASDGLARMGPGAERTALSMKLFGRGWQTIVPVLRGGSKAMQEQLDLADKYGVTFKGKTVKSLEEMIAAQRESKFAMMGLQVAFTTQLVPAITSTIQGFAGFIAQMRAGEGTAGQIVHVLGRIVGFLYDQREALLAVGVGLGAYVALTKAWALSTAVAAFATGGWTGAFWALNAAMYANPVGLVVLAVAALAAGFVYAYRHSEKFRNIVNGAWGALKDGYGWVKGNWPLLLAILTGPFGLAALAISRNLDSIVGFFQARLNNIIDIVNLAIKAFNLLPGDDIGLIGHVGGTQSSRGGPNGDGTTSGRASGGPVRAGASYRVNEQGVEILDMGRRGGYVHNAKDSAAMMGGTDAGLVAAIMALAGRPIVLQVDGREIARVSATQYATDAAFA